MKHTKQRKIRYLSSTLLLSLLIGAERTLWSSEAAIAQEPKECKQEMPAAMELKSIAQFLSSQFPEEKDAILEGLNRSGCCIKWSQLSLIERDLKVTSLQNFIKKHMSKIKNAVTLSLFPGERNNAIKAYCRIGGPVLMWEIEENGLIAHDMSTLAEKLIDILYVPAFRGALCDKHMFWSSDQRNLYSGKLREALMEKRGAYSPELFKSVVIAMTEASLMPVDIEGQESEKYKDIVEQAYATHYESAFKVLKRYGVVVSSIEGAHGEILEYVSSKNKLLLSLLDILNDYCLHPIIKNLIAHCFEEKFDASWCAVRRLKQEESEVKEDKEHKALESQYQLRFAPGSQKEDKEVAAGFVAARVNSVPFEMCVSAVSQQPSLMRAREVHGAVEEFLPKALAGIIGEYDQHMVVPLKCDATTQWHVPRHFSELGTILHQQEEGAPSASKPFGISDNGEIIFVRQSEKGAFFHALDPETQVVACSTYLDNNGSFFHEIYDVFPGTQWLLGQNIDGDLFMMDRVSGQPTLWKNGVRVSGKIIGASADASLLVEQDGYIIRLHRREPALQAFTASKLNMSLDICCSVSPSGDTVILYSDGKRGYGKGQYQEALIQKCKTAAPEVMVRDGSSAGVQSDRYTGILFRDKINNVQSLSINVRGNEWRSINGISIKSLPLPSDELKSLLSHLPADKIITLSIDKERNMYAHAPRFNVQGISLGKLSLRGKPLGGGAIFSDNGMWALCFISLESGVYTVCRIQFSKPN